MRKPGIGRTVILYFVGFVAIAAYVVDVTDRLGLIPWSSKGDIISAVGQYDKTLFMTVNSAHLLG
jgi:hypothetical protein